ncbi:MAG: hypothetical protein IJA52_00815 [Clostridia bacterium]|nr:hypothetical protein [Clostridia bacterium]
MYNFKIKDEPFARGYINSGSDSIYISTGAGYKEALKCVNIGFDEKTGFPTLDFGEMACASWCYSGQSTASWLLDLKAERTPELSEDYRYINDVMKNVDAGQQMWSVLSESEILINESHSGWGGTWYGHAVPDLCDFFRLGTAAMAERVKKYAKENPEKWDFYEGLLLTLDAVEILADRILERAREEYETTQNKKLLRVIRAFENGMKTPARDFPEAVCIYVTVYSLDGVDSPGHFDQYMYSFWEKSEYSEAREALEDIWLFFNQTRTWNLCISGSDESWNDLTNSLSYEILDVARKYRFKTPNLTMRCHRNTPERLWREAIDTIATGIGMPVLYNDEVVCPALEKLGIPPCDSHRYVMNGCNQIDIQGKSHMGLEDGEVNLGLALSYAVCQGHNIMRDRQIGARTPDCEELDTFDKFLDAMKEQIIYLCDGVCSMANKIHDLYSRLCSNPIRSLTIEGCIEKGLDYKNKGPLYGHGQILWEGVADCIDSLANIKKFVYETNKYTLRDVRDALYCDFEGYGEMLSDFRGSGLNFGNDDPYVDSIGKEVIDFANAYLLTKKTARGGYFSGGCSPFNRAADNGCAAGPLPNGKRRGESVYGDSIGATPGKDRNGPTALLNSCLSFDHRLCGSGFILNLKFEKALFASDAGKKGFFALARSYFENGGQQLSVTVVSRDELIQAQKTPELYGDIIVRVGGFSEYFVNLSPALQENVIKRTYY